MTYIVIHSEDLPDVATFTQLFDSFIDPKYPNQGKGQKAGTFKLTIHKKGIKLAQDFKGNEIENLVILNKKLSKENKQLKKALKAHLPKQDLSVNEHLIATIKRLRKKGKSYQKIADYLNKKGFKNSRGKSLICMQVSRLYKQSRAGEME